MKIIPIYYHLVSNTKNPLVQNLYTHKNIATFRKDIEVLVGKYKILDLADIQANRSGVVLTFDDGFAECYNEIYPILEQYSIPGFFFLNNDFIDNKAMFFRAKLSLLINKLNYLVPSIHKELADILKCKVTGIKNSLLAIRNEDKAFIDKLLTIAEFDIEEYLKSNQPYLTSPQISEMIKSGYYFGGHTQDHLRLKDMSAKEQEDRIVDSANDISRRFNLDYKLSSLPHNDDGISQEVFKKVSKQVDYLFGGYGLNHQNKYKYFQRISNEHSCLRIDKFINLWKFIHYTTSPFQVFIKKS